MAGVEQGAASAHFCGYACALQHRPEVFGHHVELVEILPAPFGPPVLGAYLCFSASAGGHRERAAGDDAGLSHRLSLFQMMHHRRIISRGLQQPFDHVQLRHAVDGLPQGGGRHGLANRRAALKKYDDACAILLR